MNTAAVVAASIAGAGVRSIFGYPGDPTIELMEQSRRHGLDVVLACREASAAFMAEAYAMATGRLGVTFSTLGPGSTALVNGVAAATLDRVPMVALSGQIDASREQYFTHQVVDHKLLFAAVTKWAGRVEPGAAATTMRKALRLATAERPGAVHLTCASDALTAVAEDAEVVVPPLGAATSTVAVHRSEVGGEDPRRMLAGARRPVLLAGIGALRGAAADELRRAAESLGAPVVVAPMAKGVMDETHPYFAGVLDMACKDVMWALLQSSDLIVAAGFDAVELINPWRLRTPVLHVDSTPNTDQVYASSCEVVGAIGAALEWLTDGWSLPAKWSEAEVREHQSRLRRSYYEGRLSGRLNPSDVVDVARASSPRDTLVTTDVGSHKLLVGQGWTTYEPRTVLMTNGLSAMGFGVPAAVGAAIADRSRPVVSFVGDGGFAMSGTEVRLAASLGLPLTVVVFVDGSLNRIELKQMALGYPSVATRLGDTDVVGFAVAMGCEGARASTAEELASVMAGIGTRTHPLVVEARIDPAQYASQF